MTTRNSTEAQLNGKRLKKLFARLTFAMYISSAILILIFVIITDNG